MHAEDALDRARPARLADHAREQRRRALGRDRRDVLGAGGLDHRERGPDEEEGEQTPSVQGAPLQSPAGAGDVVLGTEGREDERPSFKRRKGRSTQ